MPASHAKLPGREAFGILIFMLAALSSQKSCQLRRNNPVTWCQPLAGPVVNPTEARNLWDSFSRQVNVVAQDMARPTLIFLGASTTYAGLLAQFELVNRKS